jgi:hypothetical protein
MDRFLRYSLQKGRKIRVVLLTGGQMLQKTVLVTALTDDSATMVFSAKKTPAVVPISNILSCDYARGDHGEE